MASLVAAGVSLLAAVVVGMWKRPAQVTLLGLLAGTVVWLIDWITEVRAQSSAESIQAEDAQTAGA